MSPSTQPRGPYAKTAGRIEHILDVGTELFAMNGYRATTMKEIALRAGMSQPGLMHHFPSKDDLLIGVLRRHDEQATARALAKAEPGSVKPLIDVIAENVANPALIALDCVLSAEATSPDHPAHEFYKDRYARIRKRLVDGFSELADRGRLSTDLPPESLAVLLLSVMDGLQNQWLIAPDEIDMVGAVRDFLSMFVTNVPGDEFASD